MTSKTLQRLFPHTEKSIYFNHAATGPYSQPVKEALEAFIQCRNRDEVEIYFDFLSTIEATKGQVAQLLGTVPARVEFNPNTSYSLNVLTQGLNWQRGDRIAVPNCEFPANVYPFMNLERHGVVVDFIPHDNGVITVDAIEQTLTPRTRLLSISWVQFLSGFRSDLGAIGQLCKAYDVIFSVDAIQGLGALQLDVEAMGIDFLACSTHKWLMGAMGMGFLYLTEALQDQITPALAGWLHGPVDWDNFFDYKLEFHPDARRFQLGTVNMLGIAALNASLGLYFELGPAWCEQQVLDRAGTLAKGFAKLGMTRFGSPEPAHASGIVTVQHADPEDLFDYLKQHNVEIALRNRMLRFSPHYYNTEDEVEQVLDWVKRFDKVQVPAG